MGQWMLLSYGSPLEAMRSFKAGFAMRIGNAA